MAVAAMGDDFSNIMTADVSLQGRTLGWPQGGTGTMLEATEALFDKGCRPPKPFLRRGEGVERRVHAPKQRTPQTIKRGGVREDDTPDSLAHAATNTSNQAQDWGTWSPRKDPAAEMEEQSEREGFHDQAAYKNKQSVKGTASKSQPMKPLTARLLPAPDEDLELEEFRALEQQLRADVQGSSQSSAQSAAQSASVRSHASAPRMCAQPSSGATAAMYASTATASSAGAGAEGHMHRSYAAYHRHTSGSGGHSNQHPGQVTQMQGPQMPAPSTATSTYGQHAEARRSRDDVILPTAPVDDGFDDGNAWADQEEMGREGRGHDSASSGSGWGLPPRHTPSTKLQQGAAGCSSGSVQLDYYDGITDQRSRMHHFSSGHDGDGPGLMEGNGVEEPWGAQWRDEAALSEADMDRGTSYALEETASVRQAFSEPLLQAAQVWSDPHGSNMPQAFVRSLFKQQLQPGSQRPATADSRKAAAVPMGPSAEEVERMRVLTEETRKVAAEKAQLLRLRTDLEKAANRLEVERTAWERSKAEETAAFEATREAETKRLTRERRVLEQQGKALLKMPNKKERSQMEALQAILEGERREAKARDARQKLTVERLRQKIVELQDLTHELREQVRWLEAQQLATTWAGPSGPSGGAATSGDKSARQKPTSNPSHGDGFTPTSMPKSETAAHTIASAPAAPAAHGHHRRSLSGDATAAAMMGNPNRQASHTACSRSIGVPTHFQARHGDTQPQPSHPRRPASYEEVNRSSGDGSDGRASGGAYRSVLHAPDSTSSDQGPPRWLGYHHQQQQLMGQQRHHHASQQQEVSLHPAQEQWPVTDSSNTLQPIQHQRPTGPGSLRQLSPEASLSASTQQQPDAMGQLEGSFSFAVDDADEMDEDYGGQWAPSTLTHSDSQGAEHPRHEDGVAVHGAEHESTGQTGWHSSTFRHAAMSSHSVSAAAPSERLAAVHDDEYAQGLAMVAWQQHQEYMAEVGLGSSSSAIQGVGRVMSTSVTATGIPSTVPVQPQQQKQLSEADTDHMHIGATVSQHSFHAQQPHASQPLFNPSQQSDLAAPKHAQHMSSSHSAIIHVPPPKHQPLQGPGVCGTAAAENSSHHSRLGASSSGAPSSEHMSTSMAAEGAVDDSWDGLGARLDMLRLHQKQQASLQQVVHLQQAPQHASHHSHMQSTRHDARTSLHPPPHSQLHQQHKTQHSHMNAHPADTAPTCAAVDFATASNQAEAHQRSQQAHVHTPAVPALAGASCTRPSSTSAALTGSASFTQANSCSAADHVVREVRQADGKVERVWASGRRMVEFANGTRKVVAADGQTTVFFANGDVKRQHPAGRVDYFYAQVGTWHSTHPDGTEVFHFPSSQVEAHHTDGSKEILFPDGLMHKVLPTGEEVDVQRHDISAVLLEPPPSAGSSEWC